MHSRRLQDDRQRRLFEALAVCGKLILACGPPGVSVNLVGRFRVVRERGDDVLHVGDGTDHVHIDWTRVQHVEARDFGGEGLLVFTADGEELFKLYNPVGSFPAAVRERLGPLL